jgi:Fur family transcriptional regulator, ferric uptake regulator
MQNTLFPYLWLPAIKCREVKQMKNTRNTAARTAILELVQQSDVALSQPAVQHALNGLCDRVTIYRVLDRLVEEGLIHKIVNVNGVVNYAACNTCTHQHTHQHVHFSCRICNELTCLNQVIPTFELPSGFIQEETFFTISGVCNNCQSAKI